jgi:nucleotide-binding universal stress UspA family protein
MTMFKRILAPVDGREHSEPILPLLGAMARDSGATVRLLRVMPIPERIVGAHGRTVAYVDQEMARLTAEGMDDLRRIEDQLHDVPVENVVRFGEPVEEIVLEAEAFDADLIALAGGARGRTHRFLAPGVADRVADRAPVPTLVLRG